MDFYGPVNTVKVMTKSHTFPGKTFSSMRLTSTCAKKKNECINDFMIYLHELCVAELGYKK